MRDTKGKFIKGNTINVGKKYPQSRICRGENNGRWKGGVNPEDQREYLRKLRLATIEALGGKCKCGFSDVRALQIDHINGGGSKERKNRTFKGNFHNHVLRSFLAGENKYQLLCANCNWIKRFENKENRTNCLDGKYGV